jgi:hypothetical protein
VELTSTNRGLDADTRSQTDMTRILILFLFIKTTLYLETNFVTEKTTSALERPVGECCVEK